MKKIMAMCLAGLLVTGAAFAGGGQAGAKKGRVFGYTCMQLSNPFFTILEKSIRDAVEANGDRLITVDPAMDVAKQINQIED
ncbi:MAG: sugar ABC transporter substrate-binding protein, partial [Treponema sp.]|nr:sugar ABC transporter substrate-binding protein [Treponema sp.]